MAEYLCSFAMYISTSGIVVLFDNTVIIKDDPGADYDAERLRQIKDDTSRFLTDVQEGRNDG